MNNRQGIALGFGLALVVFLGAALFVVPKWGQLRTASGEISQFEDELARTNAGPETIAMLKERLEVLNRFGDDRITPIPREPDLAGLMRRMSEMFKGSGIAPPQLTTGVPQPDNGAMAMPMTISADGSFVGLVGAIRQIEDLPRLVRVRRVRLASESDRMRDTVDRSGMIRADLQLDVFYGTSDLAEVEAR
ncbi:MAG: hypothetical protein Tsb0013_02740 [Phycisphaerales bacterium]